jgi:arylamine N-acetyltransferase
VPEGRQLVLQAQEIGVWRDVYVFDPEPTPLIDIELSNWYTATNPNSAFVTGLIIARQLPDGTRLSLSDWGGPLTLMRRTPADTVSSQHELGEVPDLLADVFALPGFALAPDNRLVRAAE